MGIIKTVKRWFSMIFKRQAEEDFKVRAIDSPEMAKVISTCANIYRGKPYWKSEEDGIKTVNFAKAVCSETARLAMLGTKIEISGSTRADWLNGQVNGIYFRLREWVEYGLAYGTVFIAPGRNGFELYTPDDVLIVDYDNQGITGIIFKDSYIDNDRYYTRLEYHRFENDAYVISNKTYASDTEGDIGKPIPMKNTRWKDYGEEVSINKKNEERLDGMLFGVFRTPQANNIDISTPLGLPIYAEAIEELKDLDIAYSRNAGEIKDSEKIILVDDRLTFESGKKLNKRGASDVKLPHYAKNVFGSDTKEFYQEINPALNTETRLAGINALLSQIGYKCGYSNGYFVFNEKSGMVTATQVESDDRRTIQFIKDIRDKLESCLDDAIYAMSVYADLYNLSPAGTYETVYDFGDITYNREEDRQRWWQYVQNGKVPAWMYFVKFEGMSEEEARVMVEEAKPDEEAGLFGEK